MEQPGLQRGRDSSGEPWEVFGLMWSDVSFGKLTLTDT